MTVATKTREPVHVWIVATMDKTNVMLIERTCMFCTGTSSVIVGADEYDRWAGGELVQNVWPEMPTWLRETLISGAHRRCWTDMFSSDGGDG